MLPLRRTGRFQGPLAVGRAWQLAGLVLGLLLFFGRPDSLLAQGGNIRFDRLSIEHGLSQSTVFVILQDSLGFMWFGTQDGLNRYDGYEFTVFKHDPEDPTTISANFIRSIYEDRDGTLWIGTNRGLNKFDRASESFTRYQDETPDPHSLNHNVIRAIHQDRSGQLWLGTQIDLHEFDPVTGELLQARPGPGNLGRLNETIIRVIHPDDQGRLWIGTEGKGLVKLDPATGALTVYGADPDHPNSPSHNDISSIYRDPQGILWIGTEGGGLNRFEPETETFTVYQNDPADPYSLSNDNIRCLYADQAGQLWVGTWGGGLNRFNPQTETFARFMNDPANPHSLSGNQVLSIFEDRAGVLWVGTNGAGLNKFSLRQTAFTHFTNTSYNPIRLSDSIVWAIQQDRDGQLWIGTSNGLNRLDREAEKVVYYRHNSNDPTSLSSDFVPALLVDREGVLWVGTDEGGLNRFDRETETFTAYRHDPNDPTSLSDDDAWSLREDGDGVLWVGTWGGGLNRFNPETETFTRFMNDPDDPDTISDNVIRAIYEDRSGTLWLGTNSGLNRFNRATGIFSVYRHNPDDPTSLSDNVVRTIYEDGRGVLWVGADGGGLNRFDPETETFSHYREKDGLPNDTIYGILEDDQGHLWLSTNNGLSRFDSQQQTFKNYNASDGLQSNEFNQGAYFKGRNGELFFGGIDGFNAFFPAEIQDNPFLPPVVLTSFQVFNRNVPLSRVISSGGDIELSYRDSVFSFEFAALDYSAPAENQYAYMLEGFDQDWIQAGSRRFATYTNLNGGEYVFRVKGSNNDGVWNEEGLAIPIRVTPPPWKTWWAYSLYGLAAVAAVAGYVRYRTLAQARELAQQRRELAQERRVAESLRQVDRLKDEFLANTSHELRTPLNGIIGLAESLADGAAGPLPERVAADLGMIASSGRRLAHLVNDILDYARLKHEQLELQLKPVGLAGVADVVLSVSQPLVGRKPIRLVNDISPDTPPVLADENRVQQVMYNLVGNAIKFTEAGVITVSTEPAPSDNGYVSVTVTDTGIGIPADRLDRIFESFEQVDGSIAREYGGTGLGLSITRQLVELHGGIIQVRSTPGQGSAFTFTLPVSGEQPAAPVEPALPATSLAGLESQPVEVELRLVNTVQPAAGGPFSILVVDDEPVNQRVLANYLALHNYTITPAMSGPEALRLVEEGLRPDLVLLDVMMPRMSGLEVCRRLRQRYSMSQLPILMLTAKNQPQDLVAGLEAGANDYLPKPFDRRELMARVNTLLALKEAVKAHDQLLIVEQELTIARRIQRSILPLSVPRLPQLDVQVRYLPMTSVGGDYYDFHQLDEQRLGILVADVSGHGVPAALIAAMVKIAFSVQRPAAHQAGQVLTNMNQTLIDRIGKQYLTAGYIYMDLAAGKLAHASAGHWPVLVWKKRQRSLHELRPEGILMGWLPEASYDVTEMDLEPGDRIVLYTDALIETQNSAGELFGEDRLLRLMREKQELTAAQFADSVLSRLAAWSGQEHGFEDDLTLIVIDVLNSGL